MLILGNWKMSLTTSEARNLTEHLIKINIPQKIDIGVIPSHVSLSSIIERTRESKINVGAQNCYFEDDGAFTGETSPTQLKDLGCKWCLVGHSERRQLFCESDETIRRKTVALLRHDIKPILCIGETLEQRNSGRTFGILSSQLMRALEGLKLGQNFIIAYEPIWAIGTGVTADPIEIRETVSAIRDITKRLQKNTSFTILYGGSVKESNVLGLRQ
ncbi:MAG: triose-phosphate isomerase, partial [Caldisericia bacterium]